jgi:murein DD-endopeptidase MepM/ murein hydrolase activator NlpD
MRSSTAGRTPALFLLWLALAVTAAHTHGFDTIRCLLADGFDFPVGKPEAKGYHKARGFWPNGHLGEDWDGNGGGDTDLGDPIYAIGRGVVILSENVKLGWGNCVIVRHAYRDTNGRIDMVDSLYGHLLDRAVKVGQIVQKGELVGRMGSNFGMYPAHLHLEVRKNLAIGMNRTKFARDYSNYYSPTAFINAHRTLAADFQKYEIPINTFAPHGEDLNDEQRAFAASLTARPSSSSGSDNPPSSKRRETASSEESSNSRKSSDSKGVRKTGHGLSIPLTTSGDGEGKTGKSGSVPKLPDKSKPEIPTMIPPAAADETPKSDFWSRLKTKLSNGQAVDPNNPGR